MKVKLVRRVTGIVLSAGLLIAIAAFVSSCGGAGAGGAGGSGGKGPIVDKIVFDARTQEDIGLKDTAEGRIDVWNYGTNGAVFKALPDDVKDKLDVYAVTGVNYLSLLTNPVPNEAPYQVKVGGKTYFNPFAIQQVRYALNWLIDRKKIIDEIMSGSGAPMYTAVTPGQPNSSRFGLLATKQGMTPTGNEAKALADIDAAMKAAAALPENKGKLVKTGQWWTFNGQPVSTKFLIRVDDPTLRLPEGRYIADQIEKAGIKVERAELDRVAARELWGSSDPKNYLWGLYTEGWGGGQTYAFWESPITQMYAPWLANMPGGNKAGFWNYTNATLDKLTGDAYNGRVKDVNDYYSKLTEATDLGLKEAIRPFITAQVTYYAANKDRFNARMAWGAGDGLDKWSMYTADVKPETDGADKGKKVLRMSGFAAKGTLFMSSWDPLGPDGFSDTYSATIIKEASDQELEVHPQTGLYLPLRADWKDSSGKSTLKTDISVGPDGSISGKIPVPAEAVLWNAKDQKWESGINYVDVKKDGSEYDYEKPAQNTAFSSGTFTFKFGSWHDGRKIDLNDYRYAISLQYDLSVKKSADDKVYEESYAGTLNPSLIRSKGVVFNKDNSITVYSDANYPADESWLAFLLCPTLMVEASNYGSIVPWEILEAIKGIVTEGSASKTAWAYNSDSAFTEIDLLNPKAVADLKAKLQEYITAKHVPAALADTLTPDAAVAGYEAAIKFIDQHGHAYISNGGFIIDSYDTQNNTGVLVANRASDYPYDVGYWTKALALDFARIDAINVPTYAKGTDLEVTSTVSKVAFPANTAEGASGAKVKVTLVGDKDYDYTATSSKAGTYTAKIPASVLDSLKPGSYTIVVEAALGSEAGAVDSGSVIIF